jgi:hypothetical protein
LSISINWVPGSRSLGFGNETSNSDICDALDVSPSWTTQAKESGKKASMTVNLEITWIGSDLELIQSSL